MEICKVQVPPSFAVSSGHIAACWLHGQPGAQSASENGALSTPAGQLDIEKQKR
jgi:hypothetical protein